MTAIWLATSIASAWSCVTKIVVTCTSSCRRRSHSRAPHGHVRPGRRTARREEDRGSGGEGARERHALPLPARELRGVPVAERLELDELEQPVDPLADLGPRPLAHLQAERDVLAHVHVLERRVVLEDEPDVPLLRRERRGVLPESSTSPWSGPSRPAMIRSSVDLPDPLGPSKRGERPALDLERDVVERDEVAEALGDVADDDRHQAVSSLRWKTVIAIRTSTASSARTREIA